MIWAAGDRLPLHGKYTPNAVPRFHKRTCGEVTSIMDTGKNSGGLGPGRSFPQVMVDKDKGKICHANSPEVFSLK